MLTLVDVPTRQVATEAAIVPSPRRPHCRMGERKEWMSMTVADHAAAFGATLLDEIRRGRSFGGHPLWLRLLAGELSPSRLRLFAAQFFLQVVEFPRAVSALHSRCEDRQERLALAESLL